MTLKSGEPQLTMTAIFSLEDLAPFFAALCDGVTRQQTRSKPKKRSNSKLSNTSNPISCRQQEQANASSAANLINAILERDFLEPVTKK